MLLYEIITKISCKIYSNQAGKFGLPDGPYSVLNIQDYVNYIIKKHETVTVNLAAIIYVNNIYKQNIKFN